MSTKTAEPTPAEVAKRLEGKTGPEFAAELARIATESGAKVDEPKPEPAVQLTDSQFERAFSGVLSEVKTVIEEATTKLEKKYDLTHSDAKAKANDFISEAARQRALKSEEDKIIGRRFATIIKAQLGMLRNTGDYDKAFDEEKAFLQRHYGREVADMSLGTDSTGGFLSPELWETRLYQALAKTSLARKYCTQINMGNKEIMRLPKMTGGMSAYIVSEAAAATTSQPTFSQFTLQPRKCVAYSNPVSIELLESGDPNIIDLITAEAMRAFGRKEDEAVFVGSDSVFSGLLESSTNVVYPSRARASSTCPPIPSRRTPSWRSPWKS